ncbi:potassium/proton antiporter [Peptoniphilus catoniae]|uniref:potassium/proton antiporter n=1 Tax=Peptoniphilus catoniae TaxID=1660341 RepID=UPI0010FDEA4C|nr:potassium/proton antiporter [Peptoniphilus catoniae]
MGLLFIAIILIMALFAINLSDKSGIPSLLLFLTLGIICKLLGISFDNYELAEGVSTFALVVIMFYGGFGTNWKMGKPVVREAVVLASLGVVSTALLTGAFVHFFFKLPLIESMLLGSIVGSTDYASVSNILASKNLNLKYNSASLLELESGSNDPTAYTMTMLFLSLEAGSDVSVPLLILKQFILGALIGFAFAYIVSKIVLKINMQKDGLAIVFMASVALLTYSFTNVIGGNGFLAAYIFGIFIGNKPFVGKKDIVFFFDGFTELMSIGLFFTLGLLANPENILLTLPIAFIIMIFMTFVARPLSVVALMLPFKLKRNQLTVISWAGLRGAAAIAFAIMAVNSTSNLTIDIYHIVFGICFLSCLAQGSFMAYVSKKTDMIDPNDTVLKTFNFYVDKSDISFMQTLVTEGSSLIGKKVKDLDMALGFIVAKIERDGNTIVPKGNTEFKEGDVVIVAGEEYFDYQGEEIVEFSATGLHPWIGKRIVDLNLKHNKLILTINRKGKFIRASGDTVISDGDRILLMTDDHINFDK